MITKTNEDSISLLLRICKQPKKLGLVVNWEKKTNDETTKKMKIIQWRKNNKN
jgi:hypothetical protein